MLRNAILRAYDQFETKKWEKIYVALDIHGTVAGSNYKNVSKQLYSIVEEPLRDISALPEVRIILFSSCYESDFEQYIDLFNKGGVSIAYFNENPEVANTLTGCFDKKFYYNIMMDDKAGFEPYMLPGVRDAFMQARQFNPRIQELYGSERHASNAYKFAQQRRTSNTTNITNTNTIDLDR